MHLVKPLLFASLILAASLPTHAALKATSTGTEVASLPQGIITYTLPAVSASAVSTSYFSLPVGLAPVYTGTVSAVSTTGTSVDTISVADSTPPFVNTTGGTQLANLATAAQPYFVKFLTGAEAGRVVLVLSNTSSSLQLDTGDNHSGQNTPLNTSGFAVTAGAAGDSFAVFPGDTLGTLFGTTASAVAANGINGNTSSFNADTVGIYSVAQVRTLAYYFNTTAGMWEAGSSAANANNTVVYPYSALTISRRGGSSGVAAASFALSGSVPEVNILSKNIGGTTYGSTIYPVNMLLSQIQLGPNWLRGTTSFSADTIRVYDPAQAGFVVYFEDASNHWHASTAPSVNVESSVTIAAGTLVTFAQRTSGLTGANAFLQSALPYSPYPTN